MNEKQIRYAVHVIVALSLFVVCGVLVLGLIDGRLRPGGADARAAGAGGEAAGGGAAAGSRGSFGSDASTVHGLALLSSDGRRLLIVDPATGDARASRELPRQATSITATPGGVSVWVTFADHAEIEVYDTRELELETVVQVPGGAGRTPEHLTFSDTGEVLFITWSGSDVISAYTHRMRELSLRGEYDAAGTTGPVVRNRRATRVFRRDADGGFGVFFAQNGQRMGTIGQPEGGLPSDGANPGAVAAGFDGRYEYLLVGAGADQEAQVIDERDGRVRWLGAVYVSPVVRPVALSEASSEIAALTADRQRVVVVDAVDAAVVREFDLPEVAAGLYVGRGGELIVVSDSGSLFRIDADGSGQVERIADVSQLGGQAVAQVEGFTIQPQGTFACF